MGGVEPVERPLLEFGAAAPLAAVEPDQPERQRCHRLEEGENCARDALRSFILPGHVEGEDEGQRTQVDAGPWAIDRFVELAGDCRFIQSTLFHIMSES